MSQVPESVFDLVVGQPGTDLMPRSMLETYIQKTICENEDPFIFQYTTTQGSVPFRKVLTDFLLATDMYGTHITPHNILITYGNSHGLSLAISTLTRAGDSVIVEEPTYFLSGQLLRDNHLIIHSCSIRDTDGMDMDEFEALVIRHSPKIVYINPIYQNPTGTCLCVSRRERLLTLAEIHNFMILCDEPYTLLNFVSPERIEEKHRSLAATAERMYGPGGSTHLICFGSFSKILTPGLRCGWLQASEQIVRIFSGNGALNSGGGPPSIITETVRRLILDGSLTNHITFLRIRLYARRNSVCGAIRSQFENLVNMHVPDGGYFVYLQFADSSFKSASLLEFLCRENSPVKFLPGSKCIANPDMVSAISTEPCLRIAFSFYTEAELEQSIGLLRRGYDLFMGTVSS